MCVGLDGILILELKKDYIPNATLIFWAINNFRNENRIFFSCCLCIYSN